MKKHWNFIAANWVFEQMFELNVGQFKDMLALGEHNDDDSMKWLTYLRIAPEEYLEIFNGAINPPDFKKKEIPVHKDTFSNHTVLAVMIWRLPRRNWRKREFRSWMTVWLTPVAAESGWWSGKDMNRFPGRNGCFTRWRA